MNLNKIKHEDSSKDWQIWNKRSGVERSIKRLKKQLPEMECSKQLTQIIKRFYKPGYKVLDFGCASGHYFNSLKKIDKNIDYTGFDATKVYIKFAKNFFKKEKNSKFQVQNLFSMSKKYRNKFDISYCSNVFHHIPSIDIPLKNLISSAKKYCIIRTLVMVQLIITNCFIVAGNIRHWNDLEKDNKISVHFLQQCDLNRLSCSYRNELHHDKII